MVSAWHASLMFPYCHWNVVYNKHLCTAFVCAFAKQAGSCCTVVQSHVLNRYVKDLKWFRNVSSVDKNVLDFYKIQECTTFFRLRQDKNRDKKENILHQIELSAVSPWYWASLLSLLWIDCPWLFFPVKFIKTSNISRKELMSSWTT